MISRKAAKIERDADYLEDHGSRFGSAGRQAADLDAFITDGRALRDQLVAVIHGELDAGAVDRSGIADWRGQAKALISEYTVATWPPSSGGG